MAYVIQMRRHAEIQPVILKVTNKTRSALHGKKDFCGNLNLNTFFNKMTKLNCPPVEEQPFNTPQLFHRGNTTGCLK